MMAARWLPSPIEIVKLLIKRDMFFDTILTICEKSVTDNGLSKFSPPNRAQFAKKLRLIWKVKVQFHSHTATSHSRDYSVLVRNKNDRNTIIQTHRSHTHLLRGTHVDTREFVWCCIRIVVFLASLCEKCFNSSVTRVKHEHQWTGLFERMNPVEKSFIHELFSG